MIHSEGEGALPRLDDAEDARWMRRALALAERGWGRVAPNPLVGCVLVRDGAVVGEGWHSEFGAPHAEVEALRAAGGAASGATAYVTLEPCGHTGKTPPCTHALLAAGVRRVVFAAADPNPAAAGGAAVLRKHGVAVLGGVEEAAAREQNAVFFHAHLPRGSARPFAALKLALTLDAKVADAEGRSFWVTGEEARAEVHRLRAGFDAVAVGIGAALADDPRLTVRDAAVQPRVPPVRVVFDRTLRLPTTGALARTAREVPVWAVAAPDAAVERRTALERLGVRVLTASTLDEALAVLRAAGIGSLFAEGGATLAGSLLAGDLVDRMYLFQAPLLLGVSARGAFDALPGVPLSDAPRWRHVAVHTFGADTCLTLSRS